jgi:heme-degrading monooxygenase HmoA
MFARNVSVHLKPNSLAEFTRTLDEKVIPVLRKQKGFQDEIAFVAPNGTEVVSITLWDHQEDAEAYNRGTYPEVLKTLVKVLEGTPQIQSYEVSNSTFHKIAAHAAA